MDQRLEVVVQIILALPFQLDYYTAHRRQHRATVRLRVGLFTIQVRADMILCMSHPEFNTVDGSLVALLLARAG